MAEGGGGRGAYAFAERRCPADSGRRSMLYTLVSLGNSAYLDQNVQGSFKICIACLSHAFEQGPDSNGAAVIAPQPNVAGPQSLVISTHAR